MWDTDEGGGVRGDLRDRIAPEEGRQHGALGALPQVCLLRPCREGKRKPHPLHVRREGGQEAGEHDLVASLQPGPVLPDAALHAVRRAGLTVHFEGCAGGWGVSALLSGGFQSFADWLHPGHQDASISSGSKYSWGNTLGNNLLCSLVWLC